MNQPPEFAGPINLGNPGEFSMRELAETVLSLTGSHSQIVHEPLPEDDSRQRQPDITLAKNVLGWSPTTPLDEGLTTRSLFRNGDPVVRRNRANGPVDLSPAERVHHGW